MLWNLNDGGGENLRILSCSYICRRMCQDILEIAEQSLDINLLNNAIRYKFVDTPILNGISIHETNDNVVMLIPTVCSVHRLVFPHPNILYNSVSFILGLKNKHVIVLILDGTSGKLFRFGNSINFFNCFSIRGKKSCDILYFY